MTEALQTNPFPGSLCSTILQRRTLLNLDSVLSLHLQLEGLVSTCLSCSPYNTQHQSFYLSLLLNAFVKLSLSLPFPPRPLIFIESPRIGIAAKAVSWLPLIQPNITTRKNEIARIMSIKRRYAQNPDAGPAGECKFTNVHALDLGYPELSVKQSQWADVFVCIVNGSCFTV